MSRDCQLDEAAIETNSTNPLILVFATCSFAVEAENSSRHNASTASTQSHDRAAAEDGDINGNSLSGKEEARRASWLVALNTMPTRTLSPSTAPPPPPTAGLTRSTLLYDTVAENDAAVAAALDERGVAWNDGRAAPLLDSTSPVRFDSSRHSSIPNRRADPATTHRRRLAPHDARYTTRCSWRLCITLTLIAFLLLCGLGAGLYVGWKLYARCASCTGTSSARSILVS